ncbi:MAG TPA: 8-oxoguanine deaminase, partial [Solirubrobacter sp.]|nr:8-oxoguanine deaminase [Solirubrobacter sp.]
MIVEGCAVATVAGDVLRDGHVVIEGNRIVAVGAGPAPVDGERINASGCLATPGLINCHHHLYQHATRGLAQQATLFEWLVELYPVWARVDAGVERAAARAGLAALLRSGCTTASDHHYVFPRGAGDLLAIEVDAARELGIRFNPCRGSMDLGVSRGGLPPDEVVEDRDAILAAYEAALRFHDPSPGSMCRVAIAPCSPFSVTRELMAQSAEFARAHDLRLHTHMAETIEEEAFCQELFGVRPVEYLEDLGWLGGDVWLAHCVHLSDREVARFGETGTGVAHCPSSNARLGAGIAPVVPLVRAGAPVGLGVDGAASNEAGELGGELRQALLVARLRGGPAAMSCAEALELGTLHGARCLGRDDE